MITLLLQTTIDIRSEVNSTGKYAQALADPGANSGDVLGGIVASITGIALPLAAIAVLFYFLWAGFNWLTSGGDKNKVEEARNKMTNAIIGLAIVASALALSYVVNRFLGLM